MSARRPICIKVKARGKNKRGRKKKEEAAAREEGGNNREAACVARANRGSEGGSTAQ
jgi:hypothetical protein